MSTAISTYSVILGPIRLRLLPEDLQNSPRAERRRACDDRPNISIDVSFADAPEDPRAKPEDDEQEAGAQAHKTNDQRGTATARTARGGHP